MMEPDSKSVPCHIKPKKSRRRWKAKDGCSLIEYGDPDTKVVVRLLPPTLEQTDFIEQAEKNSTSFRSGYKGLTYKKGSEATQLFEEPNFSLALVKFTTRKSAELFKKEISQVSFQERKTGDNIKCSTIKPIFGELSVAPVSQTDDFTIKNDVFKLFVELREKNEGYVDIDEVRSTVKSTFKETRMKQVDQRKKLEKTKSKPKRKLVDSGEVLLKHNDKNNKHPALQNKCQATTIHGDNVPNSQQKKQQKRKQKKKKKKSEGTVIPSASPGVKREELVTSAPKASRKKKKSTKISVSEVSQKPQPLGES